VNVYVVAPVKPVTVMGLDAPVAVTPPGDDVTVNEVAAAPDAAGVNATVAVVVPVLVARPIVGTPG
jgi:hypothetical protein